MGEAAFRVIFSLDADADLDELSDYWMTRGEAWLGEKYHRDLVQRAEAELSDPASARRGRWVKMFDSRPARELLAFGIYRIIYDIDEAAKTVEVLRFWHAHRDTPPLA